MTVRKEAQPLPPVRTGVEGLVDAMQLFPLLKEWENQIALQALQQGKSVKDLRSITPFRQYLEVDKRFYLAGEVSPFSSFTSLFDASPSIEMLVSLGNFHTIRRTIERLARGYTLLNLPLDQFLQDALYNIAPYSARKYNGAISNPFGHYLTVLLEKRFHSFVTAWQREITTPLATEGTEDQAATQRVTFASLDTHIRHVQTPQTLFELIETTRPMPQDTTYVDDQEAKEKIHALSQLAGLNHKQEETLIALFVYGGNTTLLSKLRRTTTRSVRGQRQTALENIRQLGYETVSSILTGSHPFRKR